MNDKEATIKQFKESLESEYRLANSISQLREQIDKMKSLFADRTRTTDSYKSVLMNEYGVDQTSLEAIGKEALQAVVSTI